MATYLASSVVASPATASGIHFSAGSETRADLQPATLVRCQAWQGAALRRQFAVGVGPTLRPARQQRRQAQALLGEGESKEGGAPAPRKGLKREEEPKQYWQTSAEKEGKNPMSTLLPYIAILGLLTPFIILGIAFAGGFIKGPGY